MKLIKSLGLLSVFLCVSVTKLSAAPVPLFDGKSFAGWEGETNKVWRVRDGAIVGGSLEGNPKNEFLATLKSYKNFHLRLEYKLVGTQGFVNGGVQFRSKRIPNPPNEMSGFQADIGAGYSGSLYDESRRNKVLAQADTNHVARLEGRRLEQLRGGRERLADSPLPQRPAHRHLGRARAGHCGHRRHRPANPRELQGGDFLPQHHH